MKKIAILFLAITASVFTTSCDSDDDAGSVSIQGNWKLTAESEGGVPDVLDACELEQTISFTATTGNLRALDDDTPPCTYETVPFTYTVSGTNITITINDIITATLQGVIEELTTTSLRFRIISDSFQGVYDPQDISISTYVRQ